MLIPPSSVSILLQGGAVYPRVTIEGDRSILHARLYRCFPLTNPGRFISVCDSEGAEYGIIEDASALDESSRCALEGYFDRRYFTPTIRRILSLQQEASMWNWRVETNRGLSEFYLRGVRDSIHEVSPRRWQILSVDGQRYEIRDFDELDSKSKDLFEGLF